MSKELKLEDGIEYHLEGDSTLRGSTKSSNDWFSVRKQDLDKLVPWLLANGNWEWAFRDGMTLADVKRAALSAWENSPKIGVDNFVSIVTESVLSCLVIRLAAAPVGVRLKPGVTWDSLQEKLHEAFKRNGSMRKYCRETFDCVVANLEADVPAAEPAKVPCKVWRFNGKSYRSKELAEAAALARLKEYAYQDSGWGWKTAAMAAEHHPAEVFDLLANRHGSEWRITEEEVYQ